MTTRYAPRNTTYRAPRPASERQVGYARDLMADRSTDALDTRDSLTAADLRAGREVTSQDASSLITALQRAPRVQRATAPAAPVVPVSEVPAGRYALQLGDGDLDFVQVDRPTKGRYVGRVFATRIVGAPGEFREIRLSRDEQARILAAIESDTFHDVYTDEVDGEVTVQHLTGVAAAAVRFSRHYTCCAMCLSPLSDKKSRARGLGPVCAKKV